MGQKETNAHIEKIQKSSELSRIAKSLHDSRCRIPKEYLLTLSKFILKLRVSRRPTRNQIIDNVNKMYVINEELAMGPRSLKIRNIVNMFGLSGLGKRNNPTLMRTEAYKRYKRKILY